ncbi:response regulator transcription factor [Slackia isoflavoniconvertens]|uniref:helix-turn-helix transcriptional regulator n=1 Tax=Slackia isoflavoniconvertens TaxID=572010 RepID=UPI003D04C149
MSQSRAPSIHASLACGKSPENVNAFRDIKDLLCGPFSSRALAGILLTMVVSGGLRTYTGAEAPAVYHDPFIVAASTLAIAAIFLVYSLFLPHTSFKLGPLYRTAAPLFALGVAALTVFNEPDSATAYFAASAGSMFIDMLTWVLLVEIARSSRLSALLIFAVGRCAIHTGMALGEIAALAFPSMMVAFCVSSIVILIVIAGFMFSDRDNALVFEPVEEGELDVEACEPNAEKPAPTMDERIAAVAEKFGLTARETEVFTLWATGHGAKSIEEKLVLSSATVRTHIRHIYEKLDVHSRAELIELLESP